MVSNDLIAPEFYNITEELEKFSQDSDRQAIRWLNTQQERRTVSYVELNQKMNQYANAFTEKGLQKGDRVLVIIPRLPEAYFVFRLLKGWHRTYFMFRDATCKRFRISYGAFFC